MSEPDLKDLWQSQEMENAPMALEEIRKRAKGFQSKVLRRNLIEYAAGLIVVPAFALQVWHPINPLARWAAALIVIGCLVVLWQLHVRGGARRTPDASATSVLDFHRSELVRQRDALRSVWLWYLSPFVPGMVLMLVSYFIYPAVSATHSLEFTRVAAGMTTVIVVLMFLVVFLLNRLGAHRLQKLIDDLDALRG